VILVKTEVGKFSFKVTTEGHPDFGKKIEKAFEYKVCENRAEAEQVMADKKWDFTDMVNDNLKENARSNAYQSATLVYKPSEVPQEDIKERMVRDYIRMGKTEERARQLVEAALAE
jgi:hypothetical protein